MKVLLSFFLLLSSFSVLSQSLRQVREEFHNAVLNPETSRDFHEFMSKVEHTAPTILAYQAVSEALLAQVVWNPFTKLSQVVKYDKQMENVIKIDPSNIEIRFLRLAIEYNLPSFLGMSEHIEEDVQMLVSNISRINKIQLAPEYGRYIFGFLSQSNLCTSDEINLMQRSLASSQ